MRYKIKAKDVDSYEDIFSILCDYDVRIENESFKRKIVIANDIPDDVQNHLIDIGCSIRFDDE